jgi:hypothetical protein
MKVTYATGTSLRQYRRNIAMQAQASDAAYREWSDAKFEAERAETAKMIAEAKNNG